jgi:hypothetical protein
LLLVEVEEVQEEMTFKVALVAVAVVVTGLHQALLLVRVLQSL